MMEVTWIIITLVNGLDDWARFILMDEIPIVFDWIASTPWWEVWDDGTITSLTP